jgi:hypothetical protein
MMSVQVLDFLKKTLPPEIEVIKAEQQEARARDEKMSGLT